jgi:hypothetical protein
MNPGKKSGKWDDLEEMDEEDVERRSKEQGRVLGTLDSESRSLREERKSQIQIVKSLRSAIGSFEVANSGRKALLRDFHAARKESQKQKQIRDDINDCIPPPSNILLDWLADTHERLTTVDNDLTAVPMLNRELDAFSRFFEIQSAIVRKRRAEDSHESYVSLVKKMREVSRKLDDNKEEAGKIVDGVKSSPDSDGKGISRKEIRMISSRISQIDERLERIKLERTTAKKEKGRIESYTRFSKGRTGRVKLSDIRGIAASGGSLSQEEMGALLESGSLSSLNEQIGDVPVSGGDRVPRKKKRRLGVSRSGSRKGKMAGRREE